MSINYDVLRFILIIISLAFLCYFGPRKFNKHIYIKYHIINPLRLQNSLTGTLIIFALTIAMLVIFVLICSMFNINDTPKWTDILLLIIEVFIVIFATLVASQDVFDIENITQGEIAVGCFLGFTIMIFSILGILSIISTVNEKKKTNTRKAVDVAVATYGIFSIKADLSDRDIEKLDAKQNKIEEQKQIVSSNAENLNEGQKSDVINSNSINTKKEEIKLIDPPENSVFAQNSEKIIMENFPINVIKGKLSLRRFCILTNKRLVWYKSFIPINLSKWTEDKKECEIKLSDINTIEKQKWGLGHVIHIITNEGQEYKIIVMKIDKIVETIKTVSRDILDK